VAQSLEREGLGSPGKSVPARGAQGGSRSGCLFPFAKSDTLSPAAN
jgi:hypothetical protein